jgi:hypothetical protein
MADRVLITATVCPDCRRPVLLLEQAEDRRGRDMADLVDLDLAEPPQAPEVTPHACPAFLPAQARPDATTSGEVGHWARERDAGGKGVSDGR